MSGPRTEAGRRVLPWLTASHFNRGGLLPSEAHDAALADILAIELEAVARATASEHEAHHFNGSVPMTVCDNQRCREATAFLAKAQDATEAGA